MISSTSELRKLACCGLLDGFAMHASDLTQAAWSSHVTLLEHLIVKVVEPQLLEAAVTAAARLLLHASEVCADQGSTEQILALLVTQYISPGSEGSESHKLVADGDAGPLGPVECFFQSYPLRHAEQLANTCVYIICKAAHAQVLMYEPGHEMSIKGDAVGLRASVAFLLRILQEADLPEDAIWLAVCANLEDTWSELQPSQVCCVFV